VSERAVREFEKRQGRRGVGGQRQRKEHTTERKLYRKKEKEKRKKEK